jgi:hypothetical protein
MPTPAITEEKLEKYAEARKLGATQGDAGAPTSRRTTGRSGCWRHWDEHFRSGAPLTVRRFDYGFNSEALCSAGRSKTRHR